LQHTLATDTEFFSHAIRAAARGFDADRGVITFDKKSLSYAALSGCIHMRHKSMRHYTEIVEDNLRRYGIVFEKKVFTAGDAKGVTRHTEAAHKSRVAEGKADAAAVAYPNCAVVITDTDAEKLRGGTLDASVLRDTDPVDCLLLMAIKDANVKGQLLHVRAVAMGYDVRAQTMDAFFFNTYVETYTPPETARRVFQLRTALLRSHYAVSLSDADLKDRYEGRVCDMAATPESAIIMHDVRQRGLFQPAIAGSGLLAELDAEWRRKVREREPIMVVRDKLGSGTKVWLEGLTDEGFVSLHAAMCVELNPRYAGGTRRTLMAACDKMLLREGKSALVVVMAVGKVLQGAFGMSLGATMGKQATTRWPVIYEKYSKLIDTYKVGYLRPLTEADLFRADYAFVDGDGDGGEDALEP
jgi:hypothetical protein